MQTQRRVCLCVSTPAQIRHSPNPAAKAAWLQVLQGTPLRKIPGPAAEVLHKRLVNSVSVIQYGGHEVYEEGNEV